MSYYNNDDVRAAAGRSGATLHEARREPVHAPHGDGHHRPGDGDAQPGWLQVLQDTRAHRQDAADRRQVREPARAEGHVRYPLPL